MKQDEGQFFTPMQICEFIMYSLPLDSMLKSSKPLKVLDFACGAGHFLNTYANEIKRYINTQDLKEHYKNIYGIEKEYRLSKVSKVSSAMYGQNEINILYADALSSFELANTRVLEGQKPKPQIQSHSFDLLIANCDFREFNKEHFLSFLEGNLNDEILKLDTFKEYLHAFKQTSEYKKFTESKAYRDSKDEDKISLERTHFIAYAQKIEKDKLLYFSLSLNQEVLIIKAPSDIKEQKRFLGYEWSNRKGDEGLKELHSPYLSPFLKGIIRTIQTN